MAGNATNSTAEATIITDINAAITALKAQIVNSGDMSGAESKYTRALFDLQSAVRYMNSIHDPNP